MQVEQTRAGRGDPAPGWNEADALSASWDPVGPELASRLAAGLFGIEGTPTRLPSERDDTFRLEAGQARYTLKVASPHESVAALRVQTAALLHVAAEAPDLPVPRPVPALSGGHEGWTAGQPDGPPPRHVRLLTWLEGEPQARHTTSPVQAARLGAALAQLSLALSDFEIGAAPAGNSSAGQSPPLAWDLAHFQALRGAAETIDPAHRGLALAVFDAHARSVAPLAPSLRVQAVHNDLNPFNVLVDPAEPDAVTGLIDFGDLVRTALVHDVAVALAYRAGAPDWTGEVKAFLAGYTGVRTLEPAELEALPVLVEARLAMTLAITEPRARARPAQAAYILRNHPAALLGLRRLADLPEAARRALFHPGRPR